MTISDCTYNDNYKKIIIGVHWELVITVNDCNSDIIYGFN